MRHEVRERGEETKEEVGVTFYLVSLTHAEFQRTIKHTHMVGIHAIYL